MLRWVPKSANRIPARRGGKAGNAFETALPGVGPCGAAESAAKTEDYVDLSFDLHGFAVQEVRFISPAAHRRLGGRLEHGGTVNDMQVFDRSIPGNRCLQHDSSLNSCGFGDRGVLGHFAADAVALHDAGGDSDLLGRGSLYFGRRT